MYMNVCAYRRCTRDEDWATTVMNSTKVQNLSVILRCRLWVHCASYCSVHSAPGLFAQGGCGECTQFGQRQWRVVILNVSIHCRIKRMRG